jgi:hypothetical protein
LGQPATGRYAIIEKKCNGDTKIRSSKYIRDLIKPKLYLGWTSPALAKKTLDCFQNRAKFGIRKPALQPSSWMNQWRKGEGY